MTAWTSEPSGPVSWSSVLGFSDADRTLAKKLADPMRTQGSMEKGAKGHLLRNNKSHRSATSFIKSMSKWFLTQFARNNEQDNCHTSPLNLLYSKLSYFVLHLPKRWLPILCPLNLSELANILTSYHPEMITDSLSLSLRPWFIFIWNPFLWHHCIHLWPSIITRRW